MDMDQIFKRVQWIDDERRKDKDAIALLENRILALEGSLAAAHQHIKELTGEVTRLNAVIKRMDQFDATLLQQRVDTKRSIDELEKEIKQRDEETAKVRQVELKALDNNIAEIRKELEPIARLEKGLQTRTEEDSRLVRLIDELRVKVNDMRRSEEDTTRTYRLLEEGRRQDSKRVNDLLGEVTAMRKRLDEQRGQVEVMNNNLRKVETRLAELLAVETERRDAQVAFVDKQTLIQVERDRSWKEWSTRFQVIEKQASEIEMQLQKLDSTHRESKRAQQSLEELTQRVERRISEITEIQRLAEDRFRQEWVTFKADDQKRWTNYTLTQEELRSENARQYEKILDRVTQLEDLLQEEQDLLAQLNEQSEKRLQSLLALSHEWVSEYERNIGRMR